MLRAFFHCPGGYFWNILISYVVKIFPLRRTSTLALRQRKAGLLRALSVAPSLVRGSLVERFATCVKSVSAYAEGARHGPSYYLTSPPPNLLRLLTDEKKSSRQQGFLPLVFASDSSNSTACSLHVKKAGSRYNRQSKTEGSSSNAFKGNVYQL